MDPEWRADITTLILTNQWSEEGFSVGHYVIKQQWHNSAPVLLLVVALMSFSFIINFHIIHNSCLVEFSICVQLRVGVASLLLHTYSWQAARCIMWPRLWGMRSRESVEKSPEEWWLVMGSEREWADWSMWEKFRERTSWWRKVIGRKRGWTLYLYNIDEGTHFQAALNHHLSQLCVHLTWNCQPWALPSTPTCISPSFSCTLHLPFTVFYKCLFSFPLILNVVLWRLSPIFGHCGGQHC